MPDESETTKSPAGGSGLDDAPDMPFPEGKNYIIAIGIDVYGSALVSDFKNHNCEKDCRDVVDLLTRNYKNFELYSNALLVNNSATKAGVEDMLRAFISDTAANHINNNLVLFFSGHGGQVEQGYGDKLGCWIPHGCTALEYDHVIANDFLESQIKRLKTQSFLLISDACLSGKIFEGITADTRTATTGKIYNREISRWAMVSSRSNELSKAGGPGANSLFTGELLAALSNAAGSQLLVSELIGNLDRRFIYEEDQKPYAGRLSFGNGVPNNGHFVLEQLDQVDKRKKRERILGKELRSLNYDAQENCFEAFGHDVRKQVAVFTGTQDCGLKLLSWRARKAADFPRNCEETAPVAPFFYGGTGADRVLNVFTAALDKRFGHIDDLAAYLHNRLAQGSLLIEFLFYHGKGNGELEMRSEDKVALLNELMDFVSTINEGYPEHNKLMLFVTDYEQYAYDKHYKNCPISGLDTVFLPAVTQLKFEELKLWYKRMRTGYVDDKETGFDELFHDTLFKQLETVIRETGGYPGKTIQRICSLAGCDALADKLLNK